MRKIWAVALVVAFALCALTAHGAYTNTGPHKVETLDLAWHDTKRDRDIPARIYFPADATSACPVIIFSHGLGGTRDGYPYVGEHWASHGYVSIHVQHKGSDDSVWRGSRRPMAAMREATLNPANAMNRPIDISIAIDELKSLNTSNRLRGKIDLERVGVAGHSFGAWTSLAIAGQRMGLRGKSWADERVKAAIAMSAPVPPEQTRDYSKVTIPILHLTGTADNSPIGDTAAADRRIPFDSISNAPEYLVTFAGGDHMLFSGPTPRRKTSAGDQRNHVLIQGITTAFWDAYLKNDKAALDWITREGFRDALADAGVYEQKRK